MFHMKIFARIRSNRNASSSTVLYTAKVDISITWALQDLSNEKVMNEIVLMLEDVFRDLEDQVKQRKKRIYMESHKIKDNLVAHSQRQAARDEDYVHTFLRDREHGLQDEELVNGIVALKNHLADHPTLLEIPSIKRRLWSLLYALHSSECFADLDKDKVAELMENSLLLKFLRSVDDENLSNYRK